MAIHGSYLDFQGRIDAALHKADPDQSIPWASAPPWAEGFRPRRVIDLGCATGKFTAAVLRRLAGWECLRNLSELVLVEEEAGKAYLASIHCKDILNQLGLTDVRIRTIEAPVRLDFTTLETPSSSEPRLFADSELLPEVDLILASHFSYYFPDNELDLVRAILTHLTARGLAWVVIRNRRCPIYLSRQQALRDAAPVEEDEHGYAEDFRRIVANQASPAMLVDSRDLSFLTCENRPKNCLELAYLLMWRHGLEANAPPVEVNAAQRACASSEPLFSECHFVLGQRRN